MGMSARKQMHCCPEEAHRPSKQPRPGAIALHKRGMQVLLGSIERGYKPEAGAIRPVGIAYSSALPRILVRPEPGRKG